MKDKSVLEQMNSGVGMGVSALWQGQEDISHKFYNDSHH